jgi:DNA-3-methyladenine glycosylase II
MALMQTFTLVPRGPFALAASIAFLVGFTPACYSSAWQATAPEKVLEIAFPVEGSWRTVGVRARQAGDGTVTAEIVSPAEPGPDLVAEVRPQVERILSLDGDGSGFPAVGERDPVVGEIQRKYPGLRPVGFWSLYEAAAWTIIGHRIRITQAAAVKARMAERLGEPVSFGGRIVHALPSPQRLAGLDTFPGPAAPEQIVTISENWRPYRTWVTLLLRTQLEYETGEINGRQGHARTG